MLLPKDYTKQEKVLANCLSRFGFRFTEQFNILNYTVDFWIRELNMVIEADGVYGHLQTKDRIRDRKLIESGEVLIVLHCKETTKGKISQSHTDALKNIEYLEKSH